MSYHLPFRSPNSLDTAPREERDTWVVAVCSARALVAAGQPEAARAALRAARARAELEFSREHPWRTALLAAYAEAEALVFDAR